MIEKDIQKIAVEISKERSGVPVLISDLRKRIEMSDWAFDRAIVAMAKGGYFLTRNAHPTDSLTNAEKKMMIPDGNGNFYFAINPRDAEIPPGKLGGKKGGKRKGAGRPAVKTKVKRVQLQGARIPGWLMDWLKAEGDMGSKIEQALIEKYGLTTPGE